MRAKSSKQRCPALFILEKTSLALGTVIHSYSHNDEFVTYKNKNCAIYWLGDKHNRIAIINVKTLPSAVICSFQDFEQEKFDKVEMLCSRYS